MLLVQEGKNDGLRLLEAFSIYETGDLPKKQLNLYFVVALKSENTPTGWL